MTLRIVRLKKNQVVVPLKGTKAMHDAADKWLPDFAQYAPKLVTAVIAAAPPVQVTEVTREKIWQAYCCLGNCVRPNDCRIARPDAVSDARIDAILKLLGATP